MRRNMIIGAVVLLVGAVTVLVTGMTNADVLFNTHFRNTTDNVANDFHIKMVANQNITITETYEAGCPVTFNDALSGGGVQGNGTRSVTINWSGATVNQGDSNPCRRLNRYRGGTPNGLTIVESWWTFGGVKLVSPTSGRFCSADFNGTSGSGNWVVVKVELFDDITGTNLIGTQWIEGRGTGAVITNQTSDGPIYARWAFNTPGSMIPIEDLNRSFSGFGPFTPIVELPPAFDQNLFVKTLGGADEDKGYSVVKLSDGGLVVTGSAVSYGAGLTDLLLAKFDGSGNHLSNYIHSFPHC